MERWITSAKLTALALFLVMSAGAVAYEAIYVWPIHRCEDHGNWWDARDRQCLTPIPVEHFTKRAMAGFRLPGETPAPSAAPPR
ncbi:MAG TPA: hypothetical protein VG166_13510 [Caulobacteraceae bacterium]|jgi:hypothetical protein|nr:hypothetical protein [Caulobacteraceae bacterium]